MKNNRYEAAGGVVVHAGKVLVLRRPSRNEVRLPKGHMMDGEEPVAAALREIGEESGYVLLLPRADLGTRTIEFDRASEHVIRTEHFYAFTPAGQEAENCGQWEAQYEPIWLDWDAAIDALTYQNEKDWVKLAREALAGPQGAQREKDRW